MRTSEHTLDKETAPTRHLLGLSCLVLAHDNVPQLLALVGWLVRHGARVVVHVDLSAALVRDELAGAMPPGCRLLPLAESHRVLWGGFSMVAATIALLREATSDDPALRQVALLSGTHLPIQPAERVARFLFDGREHIELGFAAAESMHGKSLRRFWYRSLPGREERSALLRWANRNAWRLGRRDLAQRLRGMTPMGGAQWWSLTADCARHVIGFLDGNPWYVDFFRHAPIPDETFFHTIVGASPFAGRLGPMPLHQRMSGFSPAVLGADDLPEAVASGLPFARKFDTRVDAEAVRLALAGAGAEGEPIPAA
jgi:Core-2/I-Branching enzyme